MKYRVETSVGARDEPSWEHNNKFDLTVHNICYHPTISIDRAAVVWLVSEWHSANWQLLNLPGKHQINQEIVYVILLHGLTS